MRHHSLPPDPRFRNSSPEIAQLVRILRQVEKLLRPCLRVEVHLPRADRDGAVFRLVAGSARAARSRGRSSGSAGLAGANGGASRSARTRLGGGRQTSAKTEEPVVFAELSALMRRRIV